MRRAFTLIELLVIVAILATMVTIGVGSIASGQGAARVKGATRDVYAAIRHARSTALVTGQRVRVKYSNVKIDDETAIQIDVVGAKIMNIESSDIPEPYYVLDYADMPQRDITKEDGEAGGENIEEILFSPMSPSVVKGMCIKVEVGEVVVANETSEQRSYRISVGSNASGIFESYDSSTNNQKSAANSLSPTSNSAGDLNSDVMSEPVSVYWQTNGAVEPHKIWIYAEGTKPENGLVLNVDRYGAIKVLSGGEEDDE